VVSRRTASRTTQANPTSSLPDKAASSHALAPAWRADVSSSAYSRTCYRALDWLTEIKDDMERRVFDGLVTLLNLEVDVLFDTTSTYFETEDEDEPVARDDHGMPLASGTPAATRTGSGSRARSGPGASPRTTATTCPRS
jgi:hypothetical protein